MTDKDNLDEKLHNLGHAIDSDEKLVEDVMSRINTKPNSGPIEAKTQNIWRIIMKSPFTKLAAAAIIIIAVMFGLFDDTLNRPAYGITDVPKLLQNLKTLHFKGFSILYPENEESVSYPVECWIDFESRCYRKTKPSWKVSLRDYNCEIVEDILNDEYQMYINHTKEEAGFIKNTPLRQRLFINYQYYKNDRFLKQFTTESDQLDKFKIVAQEKIDGQSFDIWENSNDPGGKIVKFWLSPSTGKMGRYYVRYQYPVVSEDDLLLGGPWCEYIIDTIDCDTTLPVDIFNMTPPEGYTIESNKEDAPLPELLAGNIRTFNLKIHMVCTLSEESVIVGWSVLDNTNSEQDLFQNLEYGGALPKTEIELYALNPIYNKQQDETTTYVGRHLAHTQKGNTYYEWGIYVPDSNLRKNDLKSYVVMFRSNPHVEYLRKISKVYSQCTVDSSEDFKVFVLGAMAELSDDGKAPEGVTYESVLQLTKQIRESMTQ